MVEIKNSFIVVSREIKLGGMIYTCFNQTTFSFSTAHSPQQFFYSSQPQQLFPTAIAQPNRHNGKDG
jgi:hypothetical protein